jgi:ABC-2 type transport system permease protein
MTAFLTHFSIEFRTGIRNKTLLLMNYLFPLGFYAAIGLIMTQINPLFTDQLTPSMVIFAIIVATVLGLPDPLVNAREAGIFRSYKVNGIPALSILTVPGISTFLHASIVSLIVVVTAPLFFNAPSPGNPGWFAICMFVTALAHAGLAILIGVIAPSSRMTILFTQAIFLPSMLLSGMMMPYNMLPEGIARVGLLLPATHSMNAIMGLTMGVETSFDPVWSVILLLVGGLVAFALAWFLFSWDSKNSTRRGHPLLALLALVPYVLSFFIR